MPGAGRRLLALPEEARLPRFAMRAGYFAPAVSTGRPMLASAQVRQGLPTTAASVPVTTISPLMGQRVGDYALIAMLPLGDDSIISGLIGGRAFEFIYNLPFALACMGYCATASSGRFITAS